MAEQQVTTEDPKKVEAGKRLAEYSHRKREELTQMKAQKNQSQTKITYYGAGPVVIIGVLGVIGYCIYKYKAHKENSINQLKETLVQCPKETPANKFEMNQAIKWIRRVKLMICTKQQS